MKTARFLTVFICCMVVYLCNAFCVAEAEEYSDVFENGSINSTTGAVSDKLKYPVRTKDHILISNFVGAKADDKYRLKCFVYDKYYNFLGASRCLKKVTAEQILGSYPDTAFIKLAMITADNSVIDPKSLDSSGLVIKCSNGNIIDYEYYKSLENGNINSTTGKVSNGNTNPARTKELISADDFISAHADSDHYVRFFAYDGSGGYLGTYPHSRAISLSDVTSVYPNAKYVKILVSRKDSGKMTSSEMTGNRYRILLRKLDTTPGSDISLSDIKKFGENGSFKKSFTYYISPAVKTVPHILSCTSLMTSGSMQKAVISFELVDKNHDVLYYSPEYELADGTSFTTKSWRVPFGVKKYSIIKVNVTIPDGTVLKISDISFAEDRKPETCDEILFNAHQGFSGLCAVDTVASYEAAGKMGYKSCIAIPKFTADGVAVCFHDDTTIRKGLRYPDGSVIASGSADDKPISGFTFDELMQFDAGLKKNSIYAGTKVPTLDEYFAICAKYGMHPLLSVHSQDEFRGDAGKENFIKIRELAEKNGVLDKLRIKNGDATVQSAAIAVFGHDIEGYVLLQGQSSSWDPLYVAKKCGFVGSKATSIEESSYNVVMEFFYAAATDEKINNARSEGFPVSIATTGTGISGSELKRLIGMGVNEFTIDHHCSMGLDW